MVGAIQFLFYLSKKIKGVILCYLSLAIVPIDHCTFTHSNVSKRIHKREFAKYSLAELNGLW